MLLVVADGRVDLALARQDDEVLQPQGRGILEEQVVDAFIEKKSSFKAAIFVCDHRPKTKEILELLCFFFSIYLISSFGGILAKKIFLSGILFFRLDRHHLRSLLQYLK